MYRFRDAKHQSMLCRTEDYNFEVVRINTQLSHGLAEEQYSHRFTQKAKYLLQSIIGISFCCQFLSNHQNQPHSVLAKSARALTWSFIVDLKPFTMNRTATLHSCSSQLLKVPAPRTDLNVRFPQGFSFLTSWRKHSFL